MKKTIILIVGKSGSGKSTLAEHLRDRWSIPYLQSYTTRKKRDSWDNGHKYVTEEEFDNLLSNNNPLAITNWNGVRYCCLVEDLSGFDSYVIDEKGVDFIETYFKNEFNLFKVYVDREEDLRVKNVGEERVARDEGKFTKPLNSYDMVITNNHSLEGLKKQGDIMIKRINLLYTPYDKKLCRVDDPECESCQ